MRILAFIIAVLLVLTGGGCMITWLANSGGRMTDEVWLILLAFGLLPFIGGGLLFRYAWKDRRRRGEDQQ